MPTKNRDNAPPEQTGDKEYTSSQRQKDDRTLGAIFQYLQGGQLPDDESKARELALTHSQYVIQDDIL